MLIYNMMKDKIEVWDISSGKWYSAWSSFCVRSYIHVTSSGGRSRLMWKDENTFSVPITSPRYQV